MDRDFSGEISLVELLDYMKLERTRFNKRVFSIFDEDCSGEVCACPPKRVQQTPCSVRCVTTYFSLLCLSVLWLACV